MKRSVNPENENQRLARVVEEELASSSEATTDPLTGLLNWQGFVPLANFAIVSANRRAEPLALGWIALEQTGDAAVIAMAELMGRVFRDTDLLVRHGENEFGVLFSDTDESGGWIAMQHLQEEAHAEQGPLSLRFHWTVVEFNHDDVTDLTEWLHQVDKRIAILQQSQK